MIDPISLADTHDLLHPARIATLLRGLYEANAEWNTRTLPGWDQTARARAVSGRFYMMLPERFGNDSGVHHGEQGQQKFVAFDDRILLRCKLLDRGLASSNYPTAQALAWVKAGEPLEGFLFDRLHFGYRLDILGRELQDVFVCQPTGDEEQPNLWVWQIYGNPINMQTFGIQQALGQTSIRLGDHYLYEDYASAI